MFATSLCDDMGPIVGAFLSIVCVCVWLGGGEAVWGRERSVVCSRICGRLLVSVCC